jgi:DNA polymerase III alpha subunit/intein/homing endonuclease
MNFSHLHCHTQFSLLDGAANIGELFKKAKADGMKGMAITDHGNMFGVFQFVAEAAKHNNEVKPIVGCEFYVVEDRHKKQFTKELKDKRYHQLFLAKNTEGYQNLTKMCSLGFIEGAYGKYPRIDKELILKYHKGLIATTCCLGAMVPQMILKKGEEVARKEFEWWLDLFGEDYYIEMQRHNMPEQDKVNEVLVRWAKEYNVKMICSNDSHYVDKEDANAHDILLCINTGEKQSTPVIKEFLEEGQSMKGGRFGFWNDQFYFKTQAEMTQLFKDIPEAVANTEEIVDKVEILKLKKDILLPNFEVPTTFSSQDDYLYHLTYEGAKERYKDITPKIKERLDFELHTIRTMGFAGYFLIVSDFIQAGRDIGVFVGPGRGSAAGSAVAYCIGITNIDPIKYNLLFERFLNPDRKSMPDIDTDFDDEGRQKVIDYVVQKYGQSQVAQIITYGTMAAKMSIKDVARVMDLPLAESNMLAKLVPDKPGTDLNRVLTAPFEGPKSLKEKEGYVPEDIENCKRLREIMAGSDLQATVLKEAMVLEGSVRGTGIHAAGIIIAPKDLTEIIPVCVAKDSDLYVTQYEGSIIEDAGVIKMDFLGLKTLTIMRDALKMIKENHGITIVADEIPLDDVKTYELYQRGDTNGTFQFESAGMQKYLRELKPDKFDDLIAMNALYRPGPLEYIPNFINRKHGREQIIYDVPAMEEYLSDTFGICVSGDTKVYDAITGKTYRIDELENEVGHFRVQGVDENLKTTTATISHWVCNGKKPVFEVKLQNGSKVKLTANHKVLTEKGWEEIGNLKAGDYIAVPRKLNNLVEEKYDLRKLRVLAYLLGDGALSGHRNTAEFVSKDPLLIAEYIRCLEGFERLEPRTLQQVREVTRVMVAGKDKTHYHETNALVQALRDWNLKDNAGGCTSETKFVPEFVFGLEEDAIAFFLASLWDCDGHIGERLCFMKTISPHLANNIQTLLLRLGIHSVIYEAKYFTARRQKETTAYQITVYNLKAFEALIAPHLIAKKTNFTKLSGFEQHDSLSRALFIEELNTAWKGSKRSLTAQYGFDRQHLHPKKTKSIDRINTKSVSTLVSVLELPQSERNLGVRWVEIEHIIPIGEELVYDITVDDIHNFVGNNIILHNCVYQEQIMLLSQKLANFSKGDADVLRKAMGKKQKAVLDKMKGQFIEGATGNGHPKDKLEKIWTDWEAFAAYAFNKSHSTCYAFVAFQTAYLKAHYPAEYMASVLTHNQSNIEKITFFLEECKKIGVPVKGPDVNESSLMFSVNKKGDIRYGLGAIKGVGEIAVENIIAERKENGPYKNIFDFMKRQNLRTVNKKVLESLANAGAFDLFEDMHRAQFFAPSDKYESFLEHLTKWAGAFQTLEDSTQNSLFGAIADTVSVPEPALPKVEKWSLIQKLEREKEVTGIYLSGHPLDDFRMEIQSFTTSTLENLPTYQGRSERVKIAGYVTGADHRISQKGTGWGRFILQDFNSTLEVTLFSEDYQKFKHLLEIGAALFITGNWEKRWNSEEFSFKIQEIKHLADIGETMSSAISVKIPVDFISNEFIGQLEDLCVTYKGKQDFKMIFIDYTNKNSLNFISSKRKVNVADSEFIAGIERLGLEWKVS